jgi:hypothetical protein
MFNKTIDKQQIKKGVFVSIVLKKGLYSVQLNKKSVFYTYYLNDAFKFYEMEIQKQNILNKKEVIL